jgi:hypothetical protein
MQRSLNIPGQMGRPDSVAGSQRSLCTAATKPDVKNRHKTRRAGGVAGGLQLLLQRCQASKFSGCYSLFRPKSPCTYTLCQKQHCQHKDILQLVHLDTM